MSGFSWSDPNFRQRVITALVLAPLAIVAVLYLPTVWMAILFGALLLAGAWEWTRLIGFRRRRLRTIVVALNAGLMLALYLLFAPGQWPWPIWLGAAWWILALFWLRAYSFAATPSTAHLEIKVVAGSLAIVPAWWAGLWLHELDRFGLWFLFVVLLVWVADIGAYFVGKRFGSHKLAPRISPGKTREGVYGAMAGGLLFGFAVTPLLGIAQADWLAYGILLLVTVVFSVVGDLFESLIKRQAHVKDSGSLLPGHGGLLDRIDSVLAALPIFVVGRQLIGL